MERPMLSSGVLESLSLDGHGITTGNSGTIWKPQRPLPKQSAGANAEVQQFHDDGEVRHWLQQQISELESDLCSPSYSVYEIDRLRTIVRNNRQLLDLAQAALRNAPVNASSTHLAFLQQECDKAQSHVLDSVCELERVEHASN